MKALAALCGGLMLVLILLAALYVVLSKLQRQLIYYPSRASESELLRQAQVLSLGPWRDGRGELIGWRPTDAGKARRRMLVFHGNAGYALHRDYYLAGLGALPRHEWDVFLFEYPGYGARAGKPAAEQFKASALAALDQLLEDDGRPIYLTGESLGSGVACSLAAARPEQVAGLFLVTPFTSLADVAVHHYPILPVRWLLTERFDCGEDLRRYRGPVAVLLAGDDQIVPTELGLRLYDGFDGPKWLRIDPAAGHNSLAFDPTLGWWWELTEFLSSSGTHVND